MSEFELVCTELNFQPSFRFSRFLLAFLDLFVIVNFDVVPRNNYYAT